jgi:hypothetical protein
MARNLNVFGGEYKTVHSYFGTEGTGARSIHSDQGSLTSSQVKDGALEQCLWCRPTMGWGQQAQVMKFEINNFRSKRTLRYLRVPKLLFLYICTFIFSIGCPRKNANTCINVGRCWATHVPHNLFNRGVTISVRTNQYSRQLRISIVLAIYDVTNVSWFKELNPRRRVYVKIPKPARVSLKLRQNPRR